MAKKKSDSNEVNDDFFEYLAEETGGDVLDSIDSVKYFVDSGSLALNYICSGKFIGGGFPGAKISEIYGPSSSSKSLLGANALFGCQRAKGVAVLMDCENSVNKSFMQSASHCNIKKILKYAPICLDGVNGVFHKMTKVMEKAREKIPMDVPILIVYDSIGSSPCARELREANLPDNYTVADFKRIVGGLEQPGERAKICSKELRKLNPIMEKYNTTIIILNQTRDKIGTYIPTKTTAGGGQSLIFYASCRIETKTQMKIEKKLSAKKKKILGINIKLKNVKNKTHRPFIESDNIQLLFDRGINPISGLLSCLLDADRIEVSGKGSFSIKEPWSKGEKVSFRASLDKNEIPLEILLKYPALIDADTKEQVEEYLAPYKEAIDFNTESDDTVEVTDVIGYGNVDEEIDEELEG